MARKEQNAQGQTVDFAEVYKDTHRGLDDVTKIVETYTHLMDERYPIGSPRLSLDQELWEKASNMKNNYVKGQGTRHISIPGQSSASMCSTQSQADHAMATVQAIVQDPALSAATVQSY